MIDVKLLAVVRRMFAQAVFTHKVQEVAAERKEERAKRQKVGHIFLVALILGLLVAQAAYLETPLFSLAGILLGIADIIFLIVQLSFNLEQQAALHKVAALRYLDVRDDYIALIGDVMGGKAATKELMLRRDALQKEYQSICDMAPRTGQKEYEDAQVRLNKRGIVKGEQSTWSDNEIDHFLPEELRKQ